MINARAEDVSLIAAVAQEGDAIPPTRTAATVGEVMAWMSTRNNQEISGWRNKRLTLQRRVKLLKRTRQKLKIQTKSLRRSQSLKLKLMNKQWKRKRPTMFSRKSKLEQLLTKVSPVERSAKKLASNHRRKLPENLNAVKDEL